MPQKDQGTALPPSTEAAAVSLFASKRRLTETTTDGASGRHEWLFVQGMARPVLSAKAARGRDAALLRGALRDGGDQHHLLPDAARGDARAVAHPGARALHLHAEGAAPDHLRQAPRRRRIARCRVSAPRRDSRASPWRRAVPASALPEERPAAASRVPRIAARGWARRVRVSQRDVARRR